MTIERKTTFITTNGSEFPTWDEAWDYEKAYEIASQLVDQGPECPAEMEACIDMVLHMSTKFYITEK